jgi:predicted aspartyl protease
VFFAGGTAGAQQLTPEQIDAVRRGAGSMHVPDSGTVVPLFGAPELPLVEVLLDGRGPYRFLVDLGSNVVVVRRAVADDAGLEIVVDRERSDLVAASSLTLGEATFRDVWMAAYDDLDVDGVIGYNMLRGTVVVLDYPRRTFGLGAVRLPEPAGATGKRDGVLSYQVRDRLPYIPARVGQRDILLNLDTGATNHIVFPLPMADSLPLAGPPAPGPVLYNNQTGSVRNFIARLDADIVFGGFVIERPVVFFSPAVEDAWLGSAILVDSRLELDTERQVLRLTTDRPLVSPAYRTLGLGLGPVDGESDYRPITDVIPGTPATRLGLSTGDGVVSIEGVPAGELDARERRRLAAENDIVEIVLRRGDSEALLRLEVATLPE